MTLHDDARMQAAGPDPGGCDTERPWILMDIAPRDRRVDLRAERWIAGHERMRIEVFTCCKWCAGGSVHRPSPYWRRLPPGWTATHWREAEPSPDA